ncbi:MAG: hypothetical protein RIQ81_659 [Pseudomonadota bacterium]|jgi:thiol-disulfide isomerase/thioredoxin
MNLLCRKILYSSLILALLVAAHARAENTVSSRACPKITTDDLVKLQVPGRPLHIKFFASWCGSCKDDLESLRGQPSREDLILLSTFDEESAAVATLKHFDVRQRCLAGDEIARKLGVHHLPRSFRLENGKFEEVTVAKGAATVHPVQKGKS